MKNLVITVVFLCLSVYNYAQEYPEPEFTNEVYHLKKGSPSELTRLEKGHSKLETKVKVAGIGGAESAYEIEDERSGIRFTDTDLSFVFSGSTSGMMDPASMITLYKADVTNGKRKIFLQKGGGYFSTKLKSSEKCSFSIKRIRDGYWELVMDKPLPRGEYVFTSMDMDMGGMDASVTFFAFGID